MRIHLEKVGIAASLATLECYNLFSLHFCILISHRKAYQSLLINLKSESTTSDTNTVVVNREEHPLVTLWDTSDYGEACRTRGEFQDDSPAERGPGRSAKGENVMFWFLQYTDGTTVSGSDVTSMRRSSKEIWTTMLEKYKTLAPNWTALTPAQQKEFYIAIEALYPFLRLCKDHYKAQKIGVFDYTQWYKHRHKENRKHKTEPIQEDAKQDTRKRLRRTPSTSLPRRVSLRLRNSRSQIHGESNNPTTTSPSTPPHARSDSPPAPEASPPLLTLTGSDSFSPTTPDGPPCVPSVTPDELSHMPTISDVTKLPALGSSSTSASGLDKSVDSHSDTASTAACQTEDFVRFFYCLSSYHMSDMLSLPPCILKTIPNPL